MGDKLGIRTLAPDKIPFSLPLGSRVPNAVVEGNSAFGSISLNIPMRNRVRSTLPAGKSAKGVSL